MAEVTCPSPFSAAGSLAINIQVECVPYAGEYTIAWNPSDKSGFIDLSNGDLTATSNIGAWGGVRATESYDSGKWYWETYIHAASYHSLGIGTSAANLAAEVGKDIHGYGYYGQNGKKIHNNSFVNYGSAYTAGDIIGVALDLNSGKIWFSKNGVWQASGDPGAGTNPAYTGIVGTFFPMHSEWNNGTATTIRFLAADQTYSPPTGFSAPDSGSTDAFIAVGSLSLEPECLWVDIESPLTATGSLSAIPQPQILGSTFSANGSSSAVPTPAISASVFSAVAGFTCDHCFNYAQIAGNCPTPTCKIDAVFRWARIEATTPTPTAGFRVGKRIEGDCPVPDFTCIAYSGRNPSIIASAPVPCCSMRVGLSLDAVIPVPTCLMVATTHHLADIYGIAPTPTCTIIASTENIATIYGKVPCPRGKFTTTIGNVASICGRCPVPYCSMRALVGTVVSLYGRVPVPGSLVRFHASPLNVTITLAGDVPVPTMTSSVLCSLPSLILQHERGKIR